MVLIAPASEGNVPSNGLLQPADSIVLITASLLYDVISPDKGWIPASFHSRPAFTSPIYK